MSLTKEDLIQIRDIVKDVVGRELDERLVPLESEAAAIRNDLKDIYEMLDGLNRRMGERSVLDPAFMDLPDKEQLLRLNDIVLATAKRMGVQLPR